ncbi:hypothetical protein [Paraburkholderia bannensis]|uniref:hypothetical protein n=1 Tax=Paraburkholderia bannensis TaxID=765414 RepID=UPI002AAFF3E5|nr:hypothetical protein [Paraburkholderia bannensis]
MQTIVATSIDEKPTTTDAMYQYMVDCGYGVPHLNASCLALAMEYAYRPQPRFWRDLKIEDLLTSLTRLLPEWETALGADSKSRMLKEIQEILQMNRFDEANAARLLALPPVDRPADAALTSNWICRELESTGQFDDLAYARRDGNDCGGRALDMLDILSADADQGPELRIGTLVAQAYRDAVMQRRQKAHT